MDAIFCEVFARKTIRTMLLGMESQFQRRQGVFEDRLAYPCPLETAITSIVITVILIIVLPRDKDRDLVQRENFDRVLLRWYGVVHELTRKIHNCRHIP